MTKAFRVEPDPDYPGGGHALLYFPPGALPGTTADLSLFDLFREKYLGKGDWQPLPALFGPYPVRRDAQDGAIISVGPEIVNAIGEFVSVRIDVGGFSAKISWPDTVSPDPGAAAIGSIRTNADDGTQADLRGSGRTRPHVAVADPGVGLVNAPDPEADSALPPQEPRRWFWAIAAAALLLAGLLGAGWWFMSQDEVPAPDALLPVDSAAVPPIELPAPEVSEQTPPTATPNANGCSLESVDAAGAGLAARLSSVATLHEAGGCEARPAADLALRLIERDAATNDAEALLLFGHLYDPRISDPLVEGRLGLKLAKDASIALDYYTRAASAGAADAERAKRALCAATANTPDPQTAATHEELCQ